MGVHGGQHGAWGLGHSIVLYMHTLMEQKRRHTLMEHTQTRSLGSTQIVILTLCHTGIFGNTDTEHMGHYFQIPLSMCNL